MLKLGMVNYSKLLRVWDEFRRWVCEFRVCTSTKGFDLKNFWWKIRKGWRRWSSWGWEVAGKSHKWVCVFREDMRRTGIDLKLCTQCGLWNIGEVTDMKILRLATEGKSWVVKQCGSRGFWHGVTQKRFVETVLMRWMNMLQLGLVTLYPKMLFREGGDVGFMIAQSRGKELR